ncbi:MAG: Ig-like domain-containing protein [Bacteroidales bacterium]|nr:Ig-like domain-containing protein [Bacteroidales bacterium]
MKKVLSILAIFAMVALASCSTKKDPVQATITASDVTVEEGSTVKINATTNSSAKITFASDNTAVATVAADGTVTGVAAGTANITLKVAAVADEFTAAEKVIKATVTAKAAPEPPANSLAIDGDFADWAALPAGSFSKTFGDPEATHPALTHCKVYADAEKIYVYFEWDTDMIAAEEGKEHVPFHCYINTDGKADTGGYADEFADACTDVLLEGSIFPDGVLGSYDPGAYSWAGEVNGSGWSWNNLGAEGLCEGAGVEGKYEFSIDRAGLKDLGFPVADVFSIGFDIQQSWESVGILPNAAPSEDNASGVVASLQVTTQK